MANYVDAFAIDLDGDTLSVADGTILGYQAKDNSIIITFKAVENQDRINVVYNKCGLQTRANGTDVIGSLDDSADVSEGAVVNPDPEDPSDEPDPQPSDVTAQYKYNYFPGVGGVMKITLSVL